MNAPARISPVSARVHYRGADLYVSSGRPRCQQPGTVWATEPARLTHLQCLAIIVGGALAVWGLFFALLWVTP